MKKVILIEDRCIGCGACMSVAPENFTFNDEGKAEIINDTITEEAIEASEMCPVSAIAIEGNCGCNENCTCGEEYNCNDECSCGDNCECIPDNKCSENCNCNGKCSCGDNCECTPDNKCSENCNCNE